MEYMSESIYKLLIETEEANKTLDQSAMFSALRDTDIDKIMYILEKYEEGFKYKNSLGETLMHFAVKNNFEKLIDWLLFKGLNIDILDYNCRTPLHLAVSLEKGEMIRHLLENKADPTLKDQFGRSPFHMAIDIGKSQIVDLFLKHGAEILDATSYTFQSGFHIALQNENEEIFKILLNNYTGEFNFYDNSGETLLHIWARKKCTHFHLAKLVLDKGANPNVVNVDKETPLHFAILCRNFNFCKLLLQYGVDIHAKNIYEESPLHLAIRCKDVKLVDLLLKNKANANELLKDNKNLLHFIVEYYNKDILKMLLEYGADINQRDSKDMTPFHLAIKNRCFDGAMILKSAGFDVNASLNGTFIKPFIVGNRNRNRTHLLCSALHLAMMQKDADAVGFLLKNGASINLFDHLDISLAVQIGSAQVLEQLIAHGADVNAKIAGKSILETALMTYNVDVVKTLVSYGANSDAIYAIGKNNESALHLAVKSKNETYVQFLLDIGVDINIRNKSNSTALSFAENNTKIANILIEYTALLKMKTMYICEENEQVLTEKFELYYSKCLDELKKIKEHKYLEISLVKFLANDVRVWSNLSKPMILEYFKRTMSHCKYPIYHKKILENMKKGCERRDLIKEATYFLTLSVPLFRKIIDVLDNVLQNFSNRELQSFIKNMSKIES